MTWRTALTVLVFTVLLGPQPAPGAPARFWLSLDDSDDSGPAVATGYGVDGTPLRVHVWARPQTTGSTQLTNFSLNVVSQSTGFDIDPNSVTVHNPVYSTTRPRFEYVSDSADGLIDVDAGLPFGYSRGVAGVQGFTLDASAADGLGGACDAMDDFCDDSSGGESWLVASFDLVPNSDTGSAELFLQVGVNGISHAGEMPEDMEVEFGVESMGAAPPAYDPSVDIQVTHADDDPDAVLQLVTPGDYDTDGDVDAEDYNVWTASYGGSNYAADGNSDRVVNAADYTVWRDHLPMSLPEAAAPSPTPEPSGVLLAVMSLLTLAVRRRHHAPVGRSSASCFQCVRIRPVLRSTVRGATPSRVAISLVV